MKRDDRAGLDRLVSDEERRRTLAAVARAAARSADPETRKLGRKAGTESAAIEAELQALADLPPVEYDKTRDETAKRLKIRKGTLDKEVEKRRYADIGAAGSRSADPPHWDVEPWPDPVDGAALADELAAVFKRHLVLPDCAAEAIALWILHAWSIDCFGHSPLLALRSPEKRCGKTNTLILLLWLCPRSEPSSSISPSAIFRFVEQSQPTLLIDELDNAIQDNRELLAILNGGHNKAFARILRSVGDGEDYQPRRFSVWSPKALGTIMALPGTLADRSIVIPMSRKRPGDVVARVLSTDTKQFARLRSQCFRWREDHAAELTGCDPYLPSSLDDRARDNWRPLKAVADILSTEWAATAWKAAERLSAERGEDEGNGVMLLMALRDIFAENAKDIFDKQGQPDGKAMHTEVILPRLHERDARWKEYGRAEKPITDRGLARLLSGFKIKPGLVWIDGVQKRGYRLADFDDAFTRYCPEGGGSHVS